MAKKFHLNRLKAGCAKPTVKGDTVIFMFQWIGASGIKIRKGHVALVLWAGQHTTETRSYGAVQVRYDGIKCVIDNRFIQKITSAN